MSAPLSQIRSAGRRIAFVVEDARWRKPRTLISLIRCATAAALCRAAPPSGTLTILLTDDAVLEDLNTRFRGKRKPTNVLSFPANNAGDYFGDIAIAYGIADAEARASGKIFSHHAAHLAVHGVLHLLGYDHERIADARVMEPLETEILATLKIPDPYAGIKAA